MSINFCRRFFEHQSACLNSVFLKHIGNCFLVLKEAILAGKKAPDKEVVPAPLIGPFAHFDAGSATWDQLTREARRTKVRTFSHPDLRLEVEHEGYEVPTGINDYIEEVG